MISLGTKRYIDFRVTSDTDSPITGLVLADFTVIFLRNDDVCADELTLTEAGDGRYRLTYIPSSAGHDYIELYESGNDFRIMDAEDIVSSFGGDGGYTLLDEDYETPGALTVPGANPENMTLCVFLSSDWNLGLQEQKDAIGTTSLNTDGSWSTQILVPPGTYHVVTFGFRAVNVLKANLVVL